MSLAPMDYVYVHFSHVIIGAYRDRHIRVFSLTAYGDPLDDAATYVLSCTLSKTS
jgi:hypothetical protein